MKQEQQYLDYVTARTAGLRRTAYLICGDWHRAEDAVQAVLVALYVRPPRSWESVDGWVRTALARKLIDESRRPWRRRERPVESVPDHPAHAGTGHEDRTAIVEALRGLPTRQRAVVVLRYWDDLSVSETALALGLSQGTVKSHASRGLAALRTALEGTRS